MLATLRWIVPALVPAALFASLVYRTDKRREPVWLVVTTFALGAALAAVAIFIQWRVMKLTGLDVIVHGGDATGALLFLFAFVAPLRELAKVTAAWPAFRSRHFDEPYDGIVYASAAALGFSVVENALMLHRHPTGAIWIARALLSLPAHVFFASMWGYGLGRAKRSKRPGRVFPSAWLFATAGHAFYYHFTWARGPGAIVAVVPLLLAMGVVTFYAARDLAVRGDRPSRTSGTTRLSRVSVPYVSAPPSLDAVRAALRRADQPIKLRWIFAGALVTIGAIIAGLSAAVAFGHAAHVDFSIVNEHDVTTTGPVALLAAGILSAFPLSGYLVARASSVTTLLEPALATALALVVTLVVLGLAAPVAVIFAMACSPIAWALACAGAWIGRSADP